MREKVIPYARIHPVTMRHIRKIGGFDSYLKTAVWTSTKRKQGRIKLVGHLQGATGRPLDVYCGWQPKRDNLRHEVKGTDFCMLYPEAEFVRGYDVCSLLPDIEMTIGENSYYVEIDCGTLNRRKVEKRWKKYALCDRTILVVCVGNKEKGIDVNKRSQDIIAWSSSIYDKAVFTTLDYVSQDPFGKVWWDAETGTARALQTP